MRKYLLMILVLFVSLQAMDMNKTIQSRITEINNIVKTDFLLSRYENYLKVKELQNKLSEINRKIKYLGRYRKNQNRVEELKKQKLLIETKLNILGKNSFEQIVSFKKLPKKPVIKNPFMIFEGISYKRELKQYKENYKNNYQHFLKILSLLQEKYNLEKQVGSSDKQLEAELNDLELIKDIFETKLKSFDSQIGLRIDNMNEDINNQISKLIRLSITILISFFFFTILKIVLRKYIVKSEEIYLSNKILNILNFSVIILIIAFFYIDNVAYLVTILGFVSAGIAIAIKDWFMSIFGWFVIMLSGSFKVGDRIKIFQQNGNVQILGDVIDITLTKIVIHEDVTLTTYTHNRRAGRIVFVPNNVVFSYPIFNYSHSGLKSIWDGIDVTITFESNHKKAVYIIGEITKRYSKGYTDLTRKQLSKFRSVYNIKSTSVEPRIYTFIGGSGVIISCWYLNAYNAPMALRSTISAEILDAFKKEDDIELAYDTHRIEVDNGFTKTETSL